MPIKCTGRHRVWKLAKILGVKILYRTDRRKRIVLKLLTFEDILGQPRK